MGNHDFKQLLHKTGQHANTCYEAVKIGFAIPFLKTLQLTILTMVDIMILVKQWL